MLTYLISIFNSNINHFHLNEFANLISSQTFWVCTVLPYIFLHSKSYYQCITFQQVIDEVWGTQGRLLSFTEQVLLPEYLGHYYTTSLNDFNCFCHWCSWALCLPGLWCLCPCPGSTRPRNNCCDVMMSPPVTSRLKSLKVVVICFDGLTTFFRGKSKKKNNLKTNSWPLCTFIVACKSFELGRGLWCKGNWGLYGWHKIILEHCGLEFGDSWPIRMIRDYQVHDLSASTQLSFIWRFAWNLIHLLLLLPGWDSKNS